jgi:hypothetical protein
MVNRELNGECLVDRRAAPGRKLSEVQFVHLVPVVDVNGIKLVRVVSRCASVDGGNGANARCLEDDRRIDAIVLIRSRDSYPC